MNSNELMQGNLIYWNEKLDRKVEHEVLAILPNTYHTRPISAGVHSDFVGIPLDLDWLKNNGFKLSINKDSGCGHAKKGRFSLWIDNDKIIYHTNHQMTVLKEVHKLQNLYYAITQKKLLK